MKTDKSTIEKEASKFLRSHEGVTIGFVHMKDYDNSITLVNQLLIKCNELRMSRDNWRTKYERIHKIY